MRHAGLLRVAQASAVAALSTAAAAQTYELVWSDEFNGVGLDTDTWEQQIGTGTSEGLPAGWGNDELQYYTDSVANAAVFGGTLKIIAREQDIGNRDYSSARIRTKGRQEFLYGRIEARMKLPSTPGVWPAFWMLPTDSPYGGWAASGEIAIMESVNFADRIYGTTHFGGSFPNNTSAGASLADGRDFSENFHVYAIEWEPDQIRWYVDGQLYYSQTSNVWFSSSGAGNSQAPFDVPFHLLLNVAVGGRFPGDPTGESVWPQILEVDYVRAYQQIQTPYLGTAATIPGLVEAENFDEGFNGQSYFDVDPGNNGAAYRFSDADVLASDGSGFFVGWIREGEWLEYTVNVLEAGTYNLTTRVASLNTGGSFRLEQDGVDLTGDIQVPITGDWQAWTTVDATLELEAGEQIIRFANRSVDPQGFNLDYFSFEAVGGCSPADLAEPFGSLDFFDVLAYLAQFDAQDPAADLAPPAGQFDFFDVLEYLSAFDAGC